MAFLDIQDLCKTFKVGFFPKNKINVLNNINLKINQGNILILAGPNGSGKTTLLKILSTLIKPTKGKIIIDGFDILKEPSQVRNLLSFVNNEDRSFFWRLTCFENLRFFGILNNLEKEELSQAIEEVTSKLDLNEFLYKRFDLCSTGMKRRLGLARALMTRPKLLLLDEPTNSLDSKSADKVKRILLESVSKKDIAVIYVTHHFQEIEDFSCEVSYLEGGILKSISPQELIKKGNHP